MLRGFLLVFRRDSETGHEQTLTVEISIPDRMGKISEEGEIIP